MDGRPVTYCGGVRRFADASLSWRVLWRLPLMGLPLLVGCAVGRGPLTLESDDPAVRLPAIKAAQDARKAGDIPKLVDCLEDYDPAVRLFAIESLERLTGQTFEYRYYGSALERSESVRRWREYAKSSAQPSGSRATTQEATTQAATTQEATRVFDLKAASSRTAGAD